MSKWAHRLLCQERKLCGNTWLDVHFIIKIYMKMKKKKSLQKNLNESFGQPNNKWELCCCLSFSCSVKWLFVTPWTIARQTSLSFTISQNLLKLMSIDWVMPSNHLILCHPLLLMPSIYPSIRVFSNESGS